MADGRLARTRVGVLGSGEVGRRLAAGFASRGHDVMIGCRDLAKPELHEWLSGDGAGVVTGAYAEVAAHGELLALAVLGNAAEQAISEAGPGNFSGKVVIDAMNPLDFSSGFPPSLFVKDTDSLAETVQRAFPEARVVKTLNTLTAELMVDPRSLGESSSVFVSGDDPEAKALVTGLLTSMGHDDVIDLGDLSTARGTEMLLPIWLRLMGALGTPMFNFKVAR